MCLESELDKDDDNERTHTLHVSSSTRSPRAETKELWGDNLKDEPQLVLLSVARRSHVAEWQIVKNMRAVIAIYPIPPVQLRRYQPLPPPTTTLASLYRIGKQRG